MCPGLASFFGLLSNIFRS